MFYAGEGDGDEEARELARKLGAVPPDRVVLAGERMIWSTADGDEIDAHDYGKRGGWLVISEKHDGIGYMASCMSMTRFKKTARTILRERAARAQTTLF